MKEDNLIKCPLDVPFKEFMPGQIIQSYQFNDDMHDIEQVVNNTVIKHNSTVEKLYEHLENKENPHEVNPHQIGTYTGEEIDGFVEDLKNGIFNDDAITNRVLSDSCVDTRVLADGAVTNAKTDPQLGNQMDISQNIQITDRYTKSETDQIIKDKVGDGTYSKEEIDGKFEEYQAGTIVDGTIDVSKLKDDVGMKLDISANPSITDRYNKAEVNKLISENGLPKDWGNLNDIKEPTDPSIYGNLPISNIMKANEFVVSKTSVLDIDVKEVVDARGGYNNIGDRLDAYSVNTESQVLNIDNYKHLSNNETNWSPSLIQAIKDIGYTGGTIMFSNKTYKFLDKVVIAPPKGDEDYSTCRKFKLTSLNKTTLEYHGFGDKFIECGKSAWSYTPENYAKGYIDIEFNNLILFNKSNTNSLGLDMLNVRKVNLVDLEVRGFSNGIKLKGCWYSSRLKRICIWSPSPSQNTKGLILDNGVNNTSFENIAILNFDKGIYIVPSDLSSDISTNSFNNCNIEFCNIGFYISPVNKSVSGININGCHFEHNKMVFEIASSISNVYGINIENNLFYGGGARIGGNSSGGFIKGVNIDKNTFLSNDEDCIIDLGYDVSELLDNVKFGNNIVPPNYIVKKPSIKLKANPHFFESMPLYSDVQQLPWGRDDSKGVVGEIRHDNNNIYFKSLNGWKCIPFTNQYNFNGEVNKIITWGTVPKTIIAPNSTVDIELGVGDLLQDKSYVVTACPDGWLENGITYNVYKCGVDKINIRFTNTSSEQVMLASQRYNIVCQMV